MWRHIPARRSGPAWVGRRHSLGDTDYGSWLAPGRPDSERIDRIADCVQHSEVDNQRTKHPDPRRPCLDHNLGERSLYSPRAGGPK